MNKILLVIFLMMGIGQVSAQSLSVIQLRCNDQENPVAVDRIHPILSWQLISNERNVLQTSYQILVSDDSLLLNRQMGNIWNSAAQKDAHSIQVRYAGKTLEAAKKYFWKVLIKDNHGHQASSAIASWRMGLMDRSDWKNASWIAYDLMPDSLKIIPAVHGGGKKEWGLRKDVLPMFRKEFQVKKTPKQATMFISGLGHFEWSMNGKKVGDHFLDPGWTKYDQHALYVGFDVTKCIAKGSNCIGVELGNGFYFQPRERYRKLTGAYGYPKMICRLLIEYADGSTENIISDGSWKTTASPTIFSSIYGGEDYDANKEQKGWNLAGFKDAHWQQALLTTGPALNAQTAEPLKIMQEFKPLKSTRISDSIYVFDMAQNMSGIPRISVQGKKGDTVKIYTGELIFENGRVNQKASGGPSYYQYILKGGAEESWQPKFTYYGFRYIQIEGAVEEGDPNPHQLPVIRALKALHTRNAAKEAGDFYCSNQLFNQTHQLIDWAIRSNMASVFTDCPHREKLGWLEEAHLVGTSIKYRYDIASLCRKVIKDMMVAQTAEGLVPEIAPEFVEFDGGFRDSPEWGSNAILLPWYVYQWYGDKEILEESYDMMKRYVGYLQKKSDHYILTQGLGDWYDLGPKHPGVSQLTPMGVTATAFFYHDADILSQIAALLNKTEDVAIYQQLASEVKKAFHQKFFNETTKQYATGSQTANAIALYMNLVNENDRAAVLKNMVEEIRLGNHALTAGDIGFRYVLKVLDREGRSDLIVAMNNRNDVPGYGYQLAHGATALTESWAALPIVSNNHLMLGHIMEWFYGGLAGISAEDHAVGFDQILIRPQVVGDISDVKANYQSPHGLISVAWKKGVSFELNVNIPANTQAKIIVPAAANDEILEAGKKLDSSITRINLANGQTQLQVGSGKYFFSVTKKK